MIVAVFVWGGGGEFGWKYTKRCRILKAVAGIPECSGIPATALRSMFFTLELLLPVPF